MQGPIDSNDFSELKSLAQQDIFRFKRFEIHQKNAQMKVNTDAVLLGCWSNVQDKKISLDIGTGTGVIALMMAQRNPNLISWGIDIDQNSADIAELNMKKSPFFERMISKHISVQDLSHELPGYFDLIVSNPPYIKENEKGSMHQNVLEYEPHLALFVSGDDEIIFYKKIIQI